MNADDLLRCASNEYAARAASAEDLIQRQESDLFQLLAATVSGSNTLVGSADDRFRTEISSDDLVRSPEALALGKRIFFRWSIAFHSFVCDSGGEDKELRTELASAIFGKGGGAAAIIAGSLVAAFGLSPAIAALVAALLLKLIVAPAADELCSTWTKLNESKSS